MRISDWSSDVCSSDLRVIEAFIDAIWAESGLAQQSLDSYRRDLEGYARWRDGAQGGLAGADRAGLFEYLAWRTRHGWSPRSNARLLSALRAFFGHRVRQGQRKDDQIGRASGRGKSVSVRVDLGGRRIIKKKNNQK